MGEKNNKSGDRFHYNFDYRKELKSLVNKKGLPEKIAYKLIEKLDEKNVKLTKNQLNLLVNKVEKVLKEYASKDNFNSIKKPSVHDNSDLKTVLDSLEKIEERLENLENGFYRQEKDDSNNIVTTDDIEVPDTKYKSHNLMKVDPLKELPSDPESVILLMKWLQFLVDKCSRSYLSEILEYYVDIGWISDDVKIKLMNYSNGITEEKTDNKKISDLTSKEHIQSLIFIQKLKGHSFDKYFIDRIDNEISRTMKKLENRNIK